MFDVQVKSKLHWESTSRRFTREYLTAALLAGKAPAVTASPEALAGNTLAQLVRPVADVELEHSRAVPRAEAAIAPSASMPAVHAEPAKPCANLMAVKVPHGRTDDQAATAANMPAGTTAQLMCFLKLDPSTPGGVQASFGLCS